MTRDEVKVKYRKWNHRNLSLSIGVMHISNKNRLIEVLSTIDLDPGGINPTAYKIVCASKFIVDYVSVLDKIYQIARTPAEIRSYQESLFGPVKQVNRLLDPKNLYLSNSNTLTVLKTETPLMECPQWKKKDEKTEQFFDPYIMYLATDRAEGYTYSLHAEKWKTVGMSIQIKQFNKKDKVDLVFGFEPKNTEEKKLYFVSLCVENLHALITYLKKMPETANLSDSQIINELYKFVEEYNPWVKMRLTEFKKINKDYVGSGRSSYAQVSSKTQADTKAYKALVKVPRKTVKDLEEKIKSEVFGQDKVVTAICKKIKQAYAGLKPPQAPVGVFLFYGGTSTGKTELAKVIAQELMNSRLSLLKIDCNNLQLDHDISLLMGAPPGYVGYDEGGVLAGNMVENKFKVILFDEVEKATPKLFDFVLNIIDEGQALDKKGNLIDFSDSLIIFTSNIGQKEASDAILNKIGFRSEDVSSDEAGVQRRQFNRILKKKLKPEFVSRLKIHGGTYYFDGLGKEDLIKVAEKKIDEMRKTLLDTHNIILETSDNLSDVVVDRVTHKNPRAHARDVISAVQLDILADLTYEIIDRGFTNNKTKQTVTVTVTDTGYNMEFPNNDDQ